MSEQTENRAAEPDSPEDGGVPWSDPEIHQHIKWRDGDIVVSVPIKSGTTWTMNIVHQLRSGGDPDFECVYAEVPWLELVPEPGSTLTERLARLAAMPEHRRRAFKTHTEPGPLPFQAPGSGNDVKYVVILRNPEEALASMYPFIRSHSDAWFELWGIDKAEIVPPDFATFFEHAAKPMVRDLLFGFVEAWWPLRHESNVLLMHFADMKRDHQGSVRRIADFLGFEPADTEWPAILEYTSFSWMKQHEQKFDGPHAMKVPIIDPGAMLRKGETGAAHEDGVTSTMSEELKDIGGEVLSDKAALEWMYRGGALP